MHEKRFVSMSNGVLNEPHSGEFGSLLLCPDMLIAGYPVGCIMA